MRLHSHGSANNNLFFLILGILALFCTFLIFLLYKTNSQLLVTKALLNNIDGKYENVVKEFEALYEYKDRLESSFIKLKEEAGQLKSAGHEMYTAKQMHHLQNKLNACEKKCRGGADIVQDDNLSQSLLKVPLKLASEQSIPLSPQVHHHESKIEQRISLSKPQQQQQSDPNEDSVGNIFV